jgi:hypothetical protein
VRSPPACSVRELSRKAGATECCLATLPVARDIPAARRTPEPLLRGAQSDVGLSDVARHGALCEPPCQILDFVGDDPVVNRRLLLYVGAGHA